MLGILLWLNILCWLLGFVLPVPCLVLASVIWFKNRSASDSESWREAISKIALAAVGAGIVFWIYVAVQQYRGGNFYGTTTAWIGVVYSVLLIIPSALAEKNVRLWLILCAIGLLFFFGISTGEAAI